MALSSREDTQQQRLLERLRAAQGQPVSFAELRAGGIDFPAAVAGELELGGHPVERVNRQGRVIGVRLAEGQAASSSSAPRRRWPWSRRS